MLSPSIDWYPFVTRPCVPGSKPSYFGDVPGRGRTCYRPVPHLADFLPPPRVIIPDIKM